MAEAATLSAEIRERAGKGIARAQRRAGRVPAVIYGNKFDPIMISVDAKELIKTADNARYFITVIELDVDGDKHQVLPRDLQLHPVTDRPLHADFLRFGPDTRIVASVPVGFENEENSPGLARGGVLNIVRREVELRCSPLAIPDDLLFDVAGLDIGDSIHIGSITLPEGVSTLTDRDFTVATIAAPTLMPTEEEAEGVEGVEGEEVVEGEEGGEGEEGESSDSDE